MVGPAARPDRVGNKGSLRGLEFKEVICQNLGVEQHLVSEYQRCRSYDRDKGFFGGSCCCTGSTYVVT